VNSILQNYSLNSEPLTKYKFECREIDPLTEVLNVHENFKDKVMEYNTGGLFVEPIMTTLYDDLFEIYTIYNNSLAKKIISVFPRNNPDNFLLWIANCAIAGL
jgi:hypothetical protein